MLLASRGLAPDVVLHGCQPLCTFEVCMVPFVPSPFSGRESLEQFSIDAGAINFAEYRRHV